MRDRIRATWLWFVIECGNELRHTKRDLATARKREAEAFRELGAVRQELELVRSANVRLMSHPSTWGKR